MKRKLLNTLLTTLVLGVVAIAVITQRQDDEPTLTPRLVDQTLQAGITHVYDGEYPFFVGGGVATFDCNGDSKPELYFAGGENSAALYVNESAVRGRLKFSLKPSVVTDLKLVTGAYPLDIDSDGVLDLAILRRGPNVVLRGLGECEFEDVTASLGIDAGSDWTVSFSATWEGDATLPTLAFGSYLVPDTLNCASGRLIRPTSGRYTPVISLTAYCTLSMLFSDWNRDGFSDLRVSNDRNYHRDAHEQLWRVRVGEPPREYGLADGWQRVSIWGMGIASHDVTGDGKPEIYLTSQADNKLQSLESNTHGPAYRDIALERGVTAHRPYVGDDVLPSTAWHPEFDDVNNDGLTDLFVSKGNVESQIDYAKNDPNNLLLGKSDGTFVERGAEAGIASDARSRGASLVDLNLDGLLDLVVVNRRIPVEVRHNVGTGTIESPIAMGNWLAVQVRQSAPNTFAVGAWVEVRTEHLQMSREITVGGGHASGESGWVHFGLGSAKSVEIRVIFPGAKPQAWQKVESNAFYEIFRDADSPQLWSPKP